MVVIIDDRADVWEWSPNLIKVIPCKSYLLQVFNVLTHWIDDFFVGIGDINSTFLAKITPLTPSLAATTPEQPNLPSDESAQPPTSLDSPEPLVPDELEKAELEKKILLSTNNAALDEQFQQRPLAKKQEELQVVAEQGGDSRRSSQEPSSGDQPQEGEIPGETLVDSSTHPEKSKQALLKNDDRELDRIGKVGLKI